MWVIYTSILLSSVSKVVWLLQSFFLAVEMLLFYKTKHQSDHGLHLFTMGPCSTHLINICSYIGPTLETASISPFDIPVELKIQIYSESSYSFPALLFPSTVYMTTSTNCSYLILVVFHHQVLLMCQWCLTQLVLIFYQDFSSVWYQFYTNLLQKTL